MAHAFRNGPIEDIHAGIDCRTSAGKEKYSHITEGEMKSIMKNAVDKVSCAAAPLGNSVTRNALDTIIMLRI